VGEFIVESDYRNIRSNIANLIGNLHHSKLQIVRLEE